MIETFVELVQDLPVWGILLGTFVIAYIENLFPPSPSDLLLVFIGTLVGMGALDFTATLTFATLGSVAGFASAYGIGRRYGRDLIEKGWVPFISVAMVVKVERWFDKYQGLIIIGNRFLSGTRAVISFAAGMTRLPFPRTTLYCALSALVWNAILILVGMQVGSRWREVQSFLAAYGWVVIGLIILILAVWYLRKRKRRDSQSPTVL